MSCSLILLHSLSLFSLLHSLFQNFFLTFFFLFLPNSHSVYLSLSAVANIKTAKFHCHAPLHVRMTWCRLWMQPGDCLPRPFVDSTSNKGTNHVVCSHSTWQHWQESAALRLLFPHQLIRTRQTRPLIRLGHVLCKMSFKFIFKALNLYI